MGGGLDGVGQEGGGGSDGVGLRWIGGDGRVTAAADDAAEGNDSQI